MTDALHPDHAEHIAPDVWYVYDRDGEIVAVLDWRSVCERDGAQMSDHQANIAHMMAASSLMEHALKAIEKDGRDANANGDLIVPSHVVDLVSQALKAAAGPPDDPQHSI